MELFLSFFLIAAIIYGFSSIISSKEKKKNENDRVVLTLFEENCRNSNTEEIKQHFLQASNNKKGNLKDLHLKTLEILSGEKNV